MKFFLKLSSVKLREILWAAAVFFISYFAYLLTLFPTVASEDSGEFTTAIATLGIAHPSGFPLYVIMGKIFISVLPFGDIAWRVNVFSAFFAAASIAMVYFLLKLLTKHDAFSFLAALLFGSGDFFWSQAIRAEVYSLNTFLLLLILILALQWYQQIVLEKNSRLALKKSRMEFITPVSKKLLYFLCFFYGLSFGNHFLMFLAGPPLVIFIFSVQPKLLKDWKFLFHGFCFFCLGLSIYFYLPLRASMQPDFNWGDTSNWQNFWDHVTRKFYSATAVDSTGRLFEESANSDGVLRQAQDGSPLQGSFDQFYRGIRDFFVYHVWFMAYFTIKNFIENFSWFLALFAPAGFLWMRHKFRHFFWLFIGLIFFYGFGLSKLLGIGYIDKLPVDYFKDRPFFIPIFLFVFCFSVLGIFYIFEKIRTRFSKQNKFIEVVFLLFLSSLLLFGFVSHFKENDQSKNYLAHDLAKAMLERLPQNSIILISNGDNTLFPIFYLNIVEGIRKDLVFYIPSPIHVYRFFEGYERTIQSNPEKRFFTDFPFAAYAGKTYDYFGLFSEVVDRPTSDRRKVLNELEHLQLRGFESDHLDHFHLYLKARFLFDKGLAYEGIDDVKQRELFEKALVTAPESKNIFTQFIGNYYVRRGNFADAIAYLEQARGFLPQEYSLNFQLLLAYIATGQPDKTLPYLKELSENNKEQFLQDYEAVKKQLPYYDGEFRVFEGKFMP